MGTSKKLCFRQPIFKVYLYILMCLVAFDVDSRERSCGTQIFAFAASDAARLIDSRHLSVGRVDHLNGMHGAVLGAVAATHMVGQHNAVLAYPHRLTGLYELTFFGFNRLYRTCRTYLGAARTMLTAVTVFESHLRLHEGEHVA